MRRRVAAQDVKLSAVLKPSVGRDRGPFARLERLAQKQLVENNPMSSRYGIWANIMQGNLIDSLHNIEGQDSEAAVRRTTECTNSLSVFVQIQALFERAK
jgi:hypothetical protein